jgi:hypothetical protein
MHIKHRYSNILHTFLNVPDSDSDESVDIRLSKDVVLSLEFKILYQIKKSRLKS